MVTGGAGYIGSVVVAELVRAGYQVVVLDNLQGGHRQAVAKEAVFLQQDLGDKASLARLFAQHDVEAVMHLAAEIQVGASMTDPHHYFVVNVALGLNLLEAVIKAGVSRFVFSSTTAVYGEPQQIPMSEEHPLLPVNPYGEAKLMFERILGWCGPAYGLRYIALRYFNAAGATKELGEDHRPETHLIPRILRVALGKEPSIPIYGADYQTRDGTSVRDYIHVSDIARAHILALKALDRMEKGVFNLGSGRGHTVLEVIQAAQEVTGAAIPSQVKGRRSGDAEQLIAATHRARSELGWQAAASDLKHIIASAWEWQRAHPDGYG